MRSFQTRTALMLVLLIQGCGTVLPGARHQVDVRKYSFSFDGSKVFYLQDRYDYKILSEKSRTRFYVYSFDIKKKRHRKIARSAILEVSPSGPYVYIGKDWKRYKSPPLTLYDYSIKEKNPVSIVGLRKENPFITISAIEWLNARNIRAQIGIINRNPCNWAKSGIDDLEPIERETLIVEGNDGGIVEGSYELPQRKNYRFTSPDERFVLKEAPIKKRFMFHTSLYIEDTKTGKKTYITKDSSFRSFFEGIGYIFKYVGFGILEAIGLA